jgi:hypothetical protein
MEHQIVTSRAFLEERAMTLESKLLGALFRMDKQDLKIADLMASQEKLLERMNRFERQSPG